MTPFLAHLCRENTLDLSLGGCAIEFKSEHPAKAPEVGWKAIRGVLLTCMKCKPLGLLQIPHV